MNYLAACCVFKDELRYLREWVEYHRLVGVERFYMVSNDESPANARALLLPYIESGEVVFLSRPGGPFVTLQTDIYLEVLGAAMGKVRWLAFLDADEFILPVQANSVPEVLANYEQYAALAVNWACFGSSGLIEPPPLQTASYLIRSHDENQDNRTYKSIVDPGRVVGVMGPHQFILAEPWKLVDEFGASVTHPWQNTNYPFFGKQLRINHYRTRSASEFAEKLARWKTGKHPDFGSAAQMQRYWDDRHNRSDIVDETIQRFVPELRRRLQRASS